MTEREEIVNLAGQVINGIMSSDESLWTKILDRTIHPQVAASAVDIAIDMQEKIKKHFESQR